MKPHKAIAALEALAQESRLAVFRLLMDTGEQGLPAGKIAEILHIPPATLSFHLAQLSKAGLVSSERNGRMVIYMPNYKRLRKLLSFLKIGLPKKAKKEAPEPASPVQ